MHLRNSLFLSQNENGEETHSFLPMPKQHNCWVLNYNLVHTVIKQLCNPHQDKLADNNRGPGDFTVNILQVYGVC